MIKIHTPANYTYSSVTYSYSYTSTPFTSTTFASFKAPDINYGDTTTMMATKETVPFDTFKSEILNNAPDWFKGISFKDEILHKLYSFSENIKDTTMIVKLLKMQYVYYIENEDKETATMGWGASVKEIALYDYSPKKLVFIYDKDHNEFTTVNPEESIFDPIDPYLEFIDLGSSI